MTKPHIATVHALWKEHFKKGMTAIDATAGNGHDTLFLASLAKEHGGSVHALDIQREALLATQKRLEAHYLESFVTLHLSCHSSFPVKAGLIVYNLGYLPSGDKNLTTKTSTTLSSLKSAIYNLEPSGLITITCYPGHPEGAVEEAALLESLKSLSSKDFCICHHRWINKPAHPSVLIIKSML
jgi:hypothetical protein